MLILPLLLPLLLLLPLVFLLPLLFLLLLFLLLLPPLLLVLFSKGVKRPGNSNPSCVALNQSTEFFVTTPKICNQLINKLLVLWSVKANVILQLLSCTLLRLPFSLLSHIQSTTVLRTPIHVFWRL